MQTSQRGIDLIKAFEGMRLAAYDDGVCYSPSVMDGGVRRKQIDLSSENWDVVAVPWACAERVLAYFEVTNSHRYGRPSLLPSQFLDLNRPVKGAEFCSEWCGGSRLRQV